MEQEAVSSFKNRSLWALKLLAPSIVATKVEGQEITVFAGHLQESFTNGLHKNEGTPFIGL